LITSLVWGSGVWVWCGGVGGRGVGVVGGVEGGVKGGVKGGVEGGVKGGVEDGGWWCRGWGGRWEVVGRRWWVGGGGWVVVGGWWWVRGGWGWCNYSVICFFHPIHPTTLYKTQKITVT
jgi:hypothetical protein